MHQLDIALLGPPIITLDGTPIKTDRHKAIGLLAYLAVEARAHGREILATLFWPDYPKASAYSYLRRTLWELNHALGKGWIEADHESVCLNRSQGLTVDIDAFHHKLAKPSGHREELEEAVHLYRGDFMEGMQVADTAPFEEWQLQQAEYFRKEFGRALESLVADYEQNGDHAPAADPCPALAKPRPAE